MNPEAIAELVGKLSLLRRTVVELEQSLGIQYGCITGLEKKLEPVLMEEKMLYETKNIPFRGLPDSDINDSLLERLSKVTKAIHEHSNMLLVIGKRLDL